MTPSSSLVPPPLHAHTLQKCEVASCLVKLMHGRSFHSPPPPPRSFLCPLVSAAVDALPYALLEEKKQLKQEGCFATGILELGVGPPVGPRMLGACPTGSRGGSQVAVPRQVIVLTPEGQVWRAMVAKGGERCKSGVDDEEEEDEAPRDSSDELLLVACLPDEHPSALDCPTEPLGS
jgi:hypothetical protein